MAKQASLQILDYAFNKLKLTSVALRVRKANISALMLYKKLGFVEEKEDDTWISMRVVAE